MRLWILVSLAQFVATTAGAQNIESNLVQIGDDFFMREEAVDLLFSDHGNLGQSFQCSEISDFTVTSSGEYNGICVNGDEVFSVRAITWPRSSEIQLVTVCNHSIADPRHTIPIEFLRANEIESSPWEERGEEVGRVRYLGREGGWFSNTYDNILLDGRVQGIQALCWGVKKPRQ